MSFSTDDRRRRSDGDGRHRRKSREPTKVGRRLGRALRIEDRRKPERDSDAQPEESRPDESREEIRKAARESKTGASRREISRHSRKRQAPTQVGRRLGRPLRVRRPVQTGGRARSDAGRIKTRRKSGGDSEGRQGIEVRHKPDGDFEDRQKIEHPSKLEVDRRQPKRLRPDESRWEITRHRPKIENRCGQEVDSQAPPRSW
jgi:hypothetical protein